MAELRKRKGNETDIVNDATEGKVVKTDAAVTPKTPMEIAQERYRKFFTRSFWGIIMIAFFSLILYTDHILVCIFVVLIQMVVFKEMLHLRYTEAKEKNLKGFRALHWGLLFISFFYFYGVPILQQSAALIPHKILETLERSHLAITFSLYVAGFILFISTLKKKYYKYQFGQLTWTLMTLLLVVGQSNFTIQNIFKGLFWFLLPCSLIICNDIMAYFCGFFLGRKFIDRPLTRLSPNKTWEGFIGALFCTMIFGFFFASFLAQYPWFTCPYKPPQSLSFSKIAENFFSSTPPCELHPVFRPSVYDLPIIGNVTLLPAQLHALIFSLFASLIAPFGGFFASGIKRAYGVKDFDSLFPGHGGMTDRMDCQMIMTLFVHVYLVTFIQPGSMEVSQILFYINQLSLDDQAKIFDHLQAVLK